MLLDLVFCLVLVNVWLCLRVFLVVLFVFVEVYCVEKLWLWCVWMVGYVENGL